MCGAVAQLGERRDGIAKVWGSIPHGSTTLLIHAAPGLERQRIASIAATIGASQISRL